MPRVCDNCGNKMGPFEPRRRQPDGSLLCPACDASPNGGYVSKSAGHAHNLPKWNYIVTHPDGSQYKTTTTRNYTHAVIGHENDQWKTFGMHQGVDNANKRLREINEKWSPQYRPTNAHIVEVDNPRPESHFVNSSLHVAHDSGDGETIYHCPFCGSGQVTARSDGTVECDFCKSTFTVQVQPQFSTMPQTVNGVPQPMPGMPGDPTQVHDPNAPPDTAIQKDPTDEPSDKVKPTTPPPTPPGSTNGSPQHQDGSQPPNGATKPDADDPSKKNLPPWLKDKKSSKLFRTAIGVPLDEETYLAHLAISHSSDRARMIAEVRAAKENTNA